MDALTGQYKSIRESREVVLLFLEQTVCHDFLTSVPEFLGKSVRDMLVHTANTYRLWITNFGMQEQLPFWKESGITTTAALREVYRETDESVYRFLSAYKNRMEQTLRREESGSPTTLTALQLFTHVVTHEFHHKGQTMSMCRLLGHIPPDTDVIRT